MAYHQNNSLKTHQHPTVISIFFLVDRDIPAEAQLQRKRKCEQNNIFFTPTQKSEREKREEKQLGVDVMMKTVDIFLRCYWEARQDVMIGPFKILIAAPYLSDK